MIDDKNKFIFFSNTILLFIYLLINSKIGFFFNGVPWNGKIESIIILFLIPFLFILNRNFLFKKKILYLLIILVIIKTISNLLFFQKGFIFNVYSSLDPNNISNILTEGIPDEKIIKFDNKNKQRKFELINKKFNNQSSQKKLLNKINLYKTFNSFWNKNYTAVINKDLNEKYTFPLDWARGITIDDWRSLNATFHISGSTILYKNEILIFLNKGLSNKSELNKINERLFFVSSKDDVNKNLFINLQINNKDEILNLKNLKLKYVNTGEWSFQPLIYNISDNTYKNIFYHNRVHTENFGYFENKYLYKIFLILIAFTEILFFLLIASWLLLSWLKTLKTIDKIIKIKIGIIAYILTMVTPLLIYLLFTNFIFKILNINDGSYVSYLGFSYFIIIPILFYISSIEKFYNFSQIKNIILIFLIFPALLYFSLIFSYQIEYIFNYPLNNGDDWGAIFNLAKVISIYGDMTSARYCLSDMYNDMDNEFINYIKIAEFRDFFCKGELGSVYHHNPLYRYFICLLLIFFGHGNFSIYLLDVWCVLIIPFYAASILCKNKINIRYIYLFSFIYFVINFAGPSRYLLGRGKEEFLAMAFIIIAIGFLYQGFKKNYSKLLYGIIAAIIAIHIRLDKILVVIPLISFYYEPVKGHVIDMYKQIFKILIKYYMIIIFFISTITLSLLSMYLRHYIIMNELYFVHPSSYSITVGDNNRDNILSGITSIYYVLSSADFWPDRPKFPSIVLFIGTFYLSSLSFYRNKYIQDKILPSISLCVIAILISFFFFEPSAYPPRWSTHLLPFSTLGFVYLIYQLKNQYFKKNYKKFLR